MAYVPVKNQDSCKIDFIVYFTPLARAKLLDNTIDVNEELTIRVFGVGDPSINYQVSQNVTPNFNPDISGDDNECFPLMTTNCFKPTFTIPRQQNGSINGLSFVFCEDEVCEIIYGDCPYFADNYTLSVE